MEVIRRCVRTLKTEVSQNMKVKTNGKKRTWNETQYKQRSKPGEKAGLPQDTRNIMARGKTGELRTERMSSMDELTNEETTQRE